MIEGLQNIYNHGSDGVGEGKIGACIVSLTPEKFSIQFMNLAQASVIPKLKSYLEKLNRLDKEETKELYMETLSNGLLSEKRRCRFGIYDNAFKITQHT